MSGWAGLEGKGGRIWGEKDRLKGGYNHGGRVGNKGSGLDVGTPRCSCWMGTQAAVCLSHDDVMATSCLAHRLSQYSPVTQLAQGLVFPPGASDTQNKLIVIAKMMSSTMV